MEKTIFFLGAGFSADAGGPIQNQIIQTVLGNPDFESHYSGNGKSYITEALKGFKDFLINDLYINPADFDKVELEDIFTPIDRCIADNKSFGSHHIKSLIELREKIHLLMAAAIEYRVDIDSTISKNRDYIKSFADFVNGMAIKRVDDGNDTVAIITTNWDIILDNHLNDSISESNPKKLSVVDYCCYISSLEDDPKVKPGLYALGQGGYNIKYLKLHGSMNWLNCPMCQRLYVKFDEKTILSSKGYYCKHCKTNYKMSEKKNIQLRGNLLVPTFLKDLSNIQIKLVWQNAGIELSEATKIVFIGYSLPAADFEIRQLLSRSIRKDAEIEVVIYPNSPSNDAEKKRYKTVFGSRRVHFEEKTVPNYVSEL